MKKALLIDDDQGIRELIMKYLAKMDYDIKVAEDVENSLDLIRTACDFDLVVVDVEKPVRHQKSIAQHEFASKNPDHPPQRSLVVYLPSYKKNYFLCSS